MPSSRRAHDYCCARRETEDIAADARIGTQSAIGTNAFGKGVCLLVLGCSEESPYCSYRFCVLQRDKAAHLRRCMMIFYPRTKTFNVSSLRATLMGLVL